MADTINLGITMNNDILYHGNNNYFLLKLNRAVKQMLTAMSLIS